MPQPVRRTRLPNVPLFSDISGRRTAVAWIWIMDAAHTILICTSVSEYAIANFGNPDPKRLFRRPLYDALDLTVSICEQVELVAHGPDHTIVNCSYRLTHCPRAKGSVSPQPQRCQYHALCENIMLACAKNQPIKLLNKTFPAFAAHFNIILTNGTAVSVATEIIVSAARYYYLRDLKQGYVGFALNAYVYLYRFHLAPSPDCDFCLVVPETVPHYLLSCPRYRRERLKLVLSLGTARLSLRRLLAVKADPRPVLRLLQLRSRNTEPAELVPTPPFAADGHPLTRPHALENQTTNSGPPSSSNKRSIDGQHMEVFVDNRIEYEVGVDVKHDDHM
ncbi:hypothetical protein B0H19DRAFT_1060930 [Mycena capillaripes]|nr:hypothetical protein B0H19DRAFT_1060930 [Mycena capillaripes]